LRTSRCAGLPLDREQAERDTSGEGPGSVAIDPLFELEVLGAALRRFVRIPLAVLRRANPDDGAFLFAVPLGPAAARAAEPLSRSLRGDVFPFADQWLSWDDGLAGGDGRMAVRRRGVDRAEVLTAFELGGDGRARSWKSGWPSVPFVLSPEVKRDAKGREVLSLRRLAGACEPSTSGVDRKWACLIRYRPRRSWPERTEVRGRESRVEARWLEADGTARRPVPVEMRGALEASSRRAFVMAALLRCDFLELSDRIDFSAVQIRRVVGLHRRVPTSFLRVRAAFLRGRELEAALIPGAEREVARYLSDRMPIGDRAVVQFE
jgi:hypothetical protein